MESKQMTMETKLGTAGTKQTTTETKLATTGAQQITTETKQASTPRIHSVEEIFSAARNHPIYQSKLSRATSFADAPIIDKSTFFNKMSECFETPGFLKGMYISPSGGSSSGRVNYVASDIRENDYQRAILSYYLNKNNIITHNTIAVNLMPSALMYRASEIFTDFCSRANATVLPVNEQAPDEMVCRMTELCDANTIIGMPSRLVAFAEYVQKNDITVSFDHLIFAGEPMPKERREYLRKALNIRRFTGIYGSAEAGVWGFQPDNLPLNAYLIPPELIHAEIISPDEEGFGKLVVTNLVRERNPLLRYDTGDIARLSRIMHNGREMTVLELQQRAGISFEIGGNRFTISDKLAGCSNFQIRLSIDPTKNIEKASFYLVPDGLPDAQEKNEIIEAMRGILQGPDNKFMSEVHFVRLDALSKSPSSQKPIKLIDERRG